MDGRPAYHSAPPGARAGPPATLASRVAGSARDRLLRAGLPAAGGRHARLQRRAGVSTCTSAATACASSPGRRAKRRRRDGRTPPSRFRVQRRAVLAARPAASRPPASPTSLASGRLRRRASCRAAQARSRASSAARRRGCFRPWSRSTTCATMRAAARAARALARALGATDSTARRALTAEQPAHAAGGCSSWASRRREGRDRLPGGRHPAVSTGPRAGEQARKEPGLGGRSVLLTVSRLAPNKGTSARARSAGRGCARVSSGSST